MSDANAMIAEAIKTNSRILIIDVRDYDYGSGGTICGSVHIPYYQYSKICSLVEKTDARIPIAVTCMHGASRSVKVLEQLKSDFEDR